MNIKYPKHMTKIQYFMLISIYYLISIFWLIVIGIIFVKEQNSFLYGIIYTVFCFVWIFSIHKLSCFMYNNKRW